MFLDAHPLSTQTCALLKIFRAGRQADGSGWDAVEFWMRGRDALSVSTFVTPFNNGRPPSDDGARW